jgi:hypothetical protein
LFRRDPQVLRLDGECPWTVFRDAVSDRRAVVVVNPGLTPLRVANLAFTDNAKGKCRIHEPFHPARATVFPVKLTIPPERLAVIVEQ